MTNVTRVEGSGLRATAATSIEFQHGFSSMKINKLLVAATLALAIGRRLRVLWRRGLNAAQPHDGSARALPAHSPPHRVPGHELAFLACGRVAQYAALTASALRGKVVLIDFWTYTCINWLRRFPMFAPGPTNTPIRPGGDRRPRTRVLV